MYLIYFLHLRTQFDEPMPSSTLSQSTVCLSQQMVNRIGTALAWPTIRPLLNVALHGVLSIIITSR